MFSPAPESPSGTGLASGYVSTNASAWFAQRASSSSLLVTGADQVTVVNYSCSKTQSAYILRRARWQAE